MSFKPALRFHFLTRWYDVVTRHTLPAAEMRESLLNLVNAENHETVLEFGCGTGENLFWGAKRTVGTIWKGVDIDSRILAIAVEKNKRVANVRLCLYDGNHLPETQDSIDTVFSSLVFHHLTIGAKMNALREIYRVLKPGGKFVLGDWGKPRSKWSRRKFFLIQLLDGFATTQENLKGLLPDYMQTVGFAKVKEVETMETVFGSYSYYIGFKPPQELYVV